MNEIAEEYSFLMFFILGIILGIFFDTFKSTRKSFKTNDLVIFIEDFIYLLISSFLIIYTIIYYNNGILRFYIFIGLLIGIILYSLTLSRIYVIILTRLIKIIINISKIFILYIKSITIALFKIFHKDI